MTFDLLPLATIPVLYLLTAFVKPVIQPHLRFNLCSICVAVSLTWLGLLVGWLTRIDVSTVTLAILMGMSVTGIMYKSEALYKKHRIRHFWWVRLVMIVGGFYSIHLILNHAWRPLTIIAVASLLAIVIPTFLMQNEKPSTGIAKKLEDCC